MRSTYRKNEDIFLYELEFDDNSKYIGQSNNPAKRLSYHQGKWNENFTMTVIKKLSDPWREEDEHINQLRSEGVTVRNKTNEEVGKISWERGRVPTKTSWSTPEGTVAGGKTGFKKQLEAGKNPCAVDVTCPHCGATGKQMIMKRWHFDRCRSLTPPITAAPVIG
jgi:GIY-YIG catalytic domain